MAMIVRDGNSINEVALELGISSWTLRCWKKKLLGENGIKARRKRPWRPKTTVGSGAKALAARQPAQRSSRPYKAQRSYQSPVDFENNLIYNLN